MRVTETRLGLVSCPIDLVRNQAAFFKRPGQVAPCGPFRNLGSASQRCRVEQLTATKHSLNDVSTDRGCPAECQMRASVP